MNSKVPCFVYSGVLFLNHIFLTLRINDIYGYSLNFTIWSVPCLHYMFDPGVSFDMLRGTYSLSGTSNSLPTECYWKHIYH